MKVVAISHHFPPSPEVGGLRAAKVAHALRDAGAAVHVITATLPGETAGRRLVERNLEVQTVRCYPGPLDMFLAVRSFVARPRRSAAGGSDGASSDRPASTWRRWMRTVLAFPDRSQGLIPAAVKAAIPHLDDADVVYTTAPTHSTTLAGLWLKQRYGVLWVAEFRDPWSQWKGEKPNTWLSQALERSLERRCVRAADLVVCTTDGLRDWFASLLPDHEQRKVIMVRNGIEQLDPPPRERKPVGRPFRILYPGLFYATRDPRVFFEGLALLRRERGLTREDLRVEIVGDDENFRFYRIGERAARSGVDDLIELRARVPHAEVQRMIREVDLLLLLAQNQPRQVPNKLYEFLGARTPVLAFADEEGETTRMLRQVGGHFVISSTSARECAELLARALDGGARTHSPEEVLSEWTTKTQMQKLVAATAELCKTHGR